MTHPSRFLPWISVLAVVLAGCAAEAASGPAPEAGSPSTDEGITNVQEEGVDEGGIVKAAGDHLVVLRRGRLFTVGLDDASMTPICMVDAFAPGSRLGTWYDEMLIDGQQVVVIGYSYQVGATELGLFELSEEGCIRHRQTYFLRSNDYYSTRNYASRLVDGELIFYMPHYLGNYNSDGPIADSPAFRAQDEDWHAIVRRQDITVPNGRYPGNTLHTVVRCDLRAPELGCQANGILGRFGRTFYVSRDAVFVWMSDGYAASGDLPPAELYRLPLDGSRPSAMRLWGAPTDQFSFRQSSDGTLHVLVRSQSGGDWMGAPEHSGGSVGLVTIPADRWVDEGFATATWAMYTALPRPGSADDHRPIQNRFVGDDVLYGQGATWWGSSTSGATLHVYGVDGSTPARALELPHDIGRIEALGADGAVIVGGADNDLYFTSVALDEELRAVDQHIEEGASQGELRSHGFFYRARSDDEGTMALPIRSNGPGYRHLTHGSASIAFLDVHALELSELGALVASDDPVDDQCLVSCIDWYGNARPIFYRGRTFALLGYELVEGALGEDTITEVGRVHLMGDQSTLEKDRLAVAHQTALDDNPGYTPGGFYPGCSVSGAPGGAVALPLLLGLALLAYGRRRR